jgi:hypothetical protein
MVGEGVRGVRGVRGVQGVQELQEFRSCRSSEFAWLGPKDATPPEKYWGSGVTEYCFVLSCGIWLIIELLELLNS